MRTTLFRIKKRTTAVREKERMKEGNFKIYFGGLDDQKKAIICRKKSK